MLTALIAVLGTLAGGALATYTQRATDRAARIERHQQQVTDALIGLLDAVLRYREHHWLIVAQRRNGRPETPEQAEQRWRLRTSVTITRDRLALIAHGTPLVDLGEAAAWAAIELSDIPLGGACDGLFAPDVETELETGRDRSRDAHTALRQAGSAYLLATTRSRRRRPALETR
ncbi:hypothetical protein [Streptomyces clavuligerus]|uniref:Secreted protein n=1 Tax=Streptomyces clavuligerus TaxID=1901 RepID=B5GL81_STRCL|nr:hypothetical protein [Streptomyces clavuligerus]ANW18100.1 hypothetical protein BB341_07615 [Streptomyces clavuligerus]AXU12661.1 hypothetical protein D1794_07900 [Streptomyces clavuligerus]EDY47077.1 hypothetical protein SSCG_00105 [Streptomyces clavuligerus]EFG09314.1 Hypothetical protein SCLAV_4240 [Streptomyces clavuligerus]MBY6302563.1 hypothetical protein [Streptomyces clavuligerus]